MIPMNKTTSITFSPEDRRIIAKLKKMLEPDHGKQTTVGVIRIALRKVAN
jgi:hypothetical protein